MMETDDQDGQEPYAETSEKFQVDLLSEKISEKILSIRSEDSILQEASKHIESISNACFGSKEQIKELEQVDKNENISSDYNRKIELEKQVQTGEITPFEAVAKSSKSQETKGTFSFEKYLQQQAELANQRKLLKKTNKLSYNDDKAVPNKKLKISHNCLPSHKKMEQTKHKFSKKNVIPGMDKIKDVMANNDASTSSIDHVNLNKVEDGNKNKNLRKPFERCLNISKDNTGDNLNQTTNSLEKVNPTNDSGSEYFPSDDQLDSDEDTRTSSSKAKKSSTKFAFSHIKTLDDGDEDIYRQRVQENGYPKKESMHQVDNLFKVPQSIWKRLYGYQRVSVQWLWELHGRNLGGLLGDEMGLGKTVQVIAFLAGLDCSELLSDGGRFRGLGPTIIICPATLMEQWVKHFHEWWPTLRIVMLHQSGTYNGEFEYLIHSLKCGGVLVTSYAGVLRHKELLVGTQWHYVILDEGHKIRNPQAKISKAVKEFSTPHRLLLTGSPMQNSLKELWSLFDFVLPGKLGTLPVFLEHCASPITRGGYANASPLQEATALHVATILKDAITPYMLRRTKTDVKHHVSLPEKNEQVLFCSLTNEQKKLYKKYLRSEDVSFVLHERSNILESGRYRARLLIALSSLRKICNHPDLFLYTSQIDSDEEVDLSEESLEKFGFWKRAGKMTVVRSLLKIWKKQGHRVLLFTQGRQMMHILESLVQKEEYSYLRMDGTTPMSQRQQTIHLFNDDPSYFVFLLTTRVGGLGVNLTGANRVIIYDPDWNPATDAQARERAWRIGQDKNVTIYRLITAGTIEEKMYHRQVFKLLLSNKVLEDPRQRRLFKTSDLTELFNLNEPINGEASESDRLFRESKLEPMARFSRSKIEKMRKLAASLSKSISQNSKNVDKIETAESSKTISSCINEAGHNKNILRNNSNTVIKVPENGPTTATADQPLSEDKTEKDELQNGSTVTRSKYSENAIPITQNYNVDSTSCDRGSNVDLTQDSSLKDSNVLEPSDTSKKDVNNKVVFATRKSHHKHKRNKKNSRAETESISAMFEGERVSCLIGRRLGRSEVDASTSSTDDQYVLKKLFAKSTVSSAFQHEAVLSNKKYTLDDGDPMQRLARETAQENMEYVRKSRVWCWRPSWESGSPKND